MTRYWVAFGALMLALGPPSARAYGPVGHQIVGAIADERLAHTAASAKIRAMLQGFSLEKAAVIPDEIKGWDKNGVDAPGIFRYTSRPRVDAQLAEFWRANQPTHDRDSPAPSHHWFHYTDVPVLNGAKYSEGKAGRSQWDVVHMIGYCVRVLQGSEPEDNPRKITKPLAVILLAHLVGDIHQPLHVGAQYFDRAGHPVDPDKEPEALEDEGGNTILLKHSPAAGRRLHHRQSKLHSFWDNQSVALNLPELPKEMPKEERKARTNDARRQLVREFAHEEPHAWRAPADVPAEKYGEIWADEILPLARAAHERLQFSNVRAQEEEDRVVAVGMATAKPAAGGVPYEEWAAQVVREQLHKAGWRLADLLEHALR